MRRRKYSAHAIAVEVGVDDHTVAKAIRWYDAGGRCPSDV